MGISQAGKTIVGRTASNALGGASRTGKGGQPQYMNLEQYQAADPRITWDAEMAKQANEAAKGKQPPPYQGQNAFTSQQIGQALRQQALQQEALKQQPQQPSGWGTLT